MASTVELQGLDKLGRRFSALPDTLYAGVKVEGPATDYAFVWEFGSARITKPGPKTTWGTTPDGDTVILTIQAPHGYIRVNRQEYRRILKDEWGKIAWSEISKDKWNQTLKTMLTVVASRCADVIKAAAPVDTHQLADSISAADPDDNIFGSSNPETEFE